MCVAASKQSSTAKRPSGAAFLLSFVSLSFGPCAQFLTDFFTQAAQFGEWNYGPQHGFARITRWHLEKAPERMPSGDVEAIFSLMDNEFTRSMWSYP